MSRFGQSWSERYKGGYDVHYKGTVDAGGFDCIEVKILRANFFETFLCRETGEAERVVRERISRYQKADAAFDAGDAA